jgi:hypothetical protein
VSGLVFEHGQPAADAPVLLFGEDVDDPRLLGMSGDTVKITCPRCRLVLGNVPVEMTRGELGAIVGEQVTPLLDYHKRRCTP